LGHLSLRSLGFSNQVGWFWVPGRRWGPAWVSWRSSDEYLAWAPLPPAYDEDASINIAIETVPDYYWQVVPTESFVSADRFAPILQETRPLGNVTINNNVVVNNVVNVTCIEQKTNEKVIVHQVEKTEDATKAGKIEGAAVEVFQPPAEQAPKTAAPPKPKKIEEVAVESKTKEQGAGKPTTEELLIPPEIKKPAGEAAPLPPLPPGEAEAPQGKPEGKQKKAKGEQPQPGGPPAMQPGMAPPLPPPGEAEAPQGGQQGKQKKAKGEPQPEGPPAMQPGMAPPSPPPQEAEAPRSKPEGKQKKAKKGGAPCPEGTVPIDDGTCAPAQ
jgi:hypothetical protein